MHFLFLHRFINEIFPESAQMTGQTIDKTIEAHHSERINRK